MQSGDFPRDTSPFLLTFPKALPAHALLCGMVFAPQPSAPSVRGRPA